MTYPTRTGTKLPPQARALQDRVQAITGTGPNPPDQQAIVRADAEKLGTYALQANRISAAPTADQYNALVSDLRAIAAILNAMGAQITGL